MNTDVRMAEKEDIPALCKIWESCFSDSEEYINYFYSENFERIKTLVLTVNGKPVSMVNILPASFESKRGSQPAKFIYAVGTLPEYRNQGYMGKLIRFTTNKAKENGYALFLKPSTPSLIKFYKSYGFEVDSYFRLVTINPSEKQPLEVYDLSYTEYNRMRNTAFSDIPYVKWDDAHIHWSIKDNEYFSGRTLGINYENKDYFLMGYPEDNTLIINETDLTLDQLKKLSGALCDTFGTELIKAYMPGFSCEEGEKIISSVLYNTLACNTYVNLIMI